MSATTTASPAACRRSDTDRRARCRGRGWFPAYRTGPATNPSSEEHTYELKSLIRISYAVFCSNTKPLLDYSLQTLAQNHTYNALSDLLNSSEMKGNISYESPVDNTKLI